MASYTDLARNAYLEYLLVTDPGLKDLDPMGRIRAGFTLWSALDEKQKEGWIAAVKHIVDDIQVID